MRLNYLHHTGLALVLLIAAPSAIGQELDTEFTVFGGYRFGGSIDILDTDATYEVQETTVEGNCPFATYTSISSI